MTNVVETYLEATDPDVDFVERRRWRQREQLRLIRELVLLAAETDRNLDAAVSDARALHITYPDIAAAIGCSVTIARKRCARHDR